MAEVTEERMHSKFFDWASKKGFVTDFLFFEDGNNFVNDETRLAYEIWMAATEATLSALGAHDERKGES